MAYKNGHTSSLPKTPSNKNETQSRSSRSSVVRKREAKKVAALPLPEKAPYLAKAPAKIV